MSTLLRLLTIMLLCFNATSSLASSAIDAIDTLERNILTARLQGNYTQALRLCEQLKAIPDGKERGIALELDTKLTALSWDAKAGFKTRDLIAQTETLIRQCKQKGTPPNANQLFLCGRGHFARAYLSAMDGKFYAAGTHGSDAIEAFETALQLDPALTDVKLPLGMAYFYADHLPAFAKFVAPVLWFIPKGNSDKSLPYIQEVMTSNGAYADAARFIYSDLITQQAPERMHQAIQELQDLTHRYPMNPRLHLALVSSYAYSEQWAKALDALTPLRQHAAPDSDFQNVGHIWAIYILKYLNRPIPIALQQALFSITTDQIPGWAADWFTLAQGLTLDFQQDRQGAIKKYQTVLASQNNFNSGWLLDLAKTGLNENLFPMAPAG